MPSPAQHPEPVLNYFILRRAIGAAGFLLPVGLFVFGFVQKWDDQPGTISEYYHTPARDIFVGLMTCIAAFLYCYTGYDRVDNFMTNAAGLAAIGVAFFPADTDSGPRSTVGTIHLICAGIFFFSLAVISIWLFRKSGGQAEPTSQKKKRNAVHLLCGLTILVCLAAILVWLSQDGKPSIAAINHSYRPVFWIESLAVWAFALSWMVKGQAILADHTPVHGSGGP